MKVIRINDNSRSAFTPEPTQYTVQCCLEKDSGFRRQLHFALATDMTCQLSKEVTDRGHTYSKRVFKTRWLEIQLPRWRVELGLWTSSGFLKTMTFLPRVKTVLRCMLPSWSWRERQLKRRSLRWRFEVSFSRPEQTQLFVQFWKQNGEQEEQAFAQCSKR